MKLVALDIRSRIPFPRMFARAVCGNVAIEYALVATGISVGIIAAVVVIGVTLRDSYFDQIVAAFTG